MKYTYYAGTIYFLLLITQLYAHFYLYCLMIHQKKFSATYIK